MPVREMLNSNNPTKVAIVVHIQHLDLWSEIAQHLQSINYPYDLFITTTESLHSKSLTLLEEFPQAIIRTFSDSNSNTLPFFELIPELTDSGYIAVCKLYTKPDEDELTSIWRKLILDTLISDDSTIQKVTQAFVDDEQLAIIGTGALYLSAQKMMSEQTQKHVQNAVRKLGITELPQDWGFFAGNMFWVRPTSLQKLSEKFGYFFKERIACNQTDNELEHILECLLTFLSVSSQQKIALLLPSTGLHKQMVLQKKISHQTINQAYPKELLQQYQRLTRDRAHLIKSSLFNNTTYLQQYPELSGCSVDLPSHYLLIGYFQQAKPHPDFDPCFYTSKHSSRFTASESSFLQKGVKSECLLQSKQQKHQTPSSTVLSADDLLIIARDIT